MTSAKSIENLSLAAGALAIACLLAGAAQGQQDLGQTQGQGEQQDQDLQQIVEPAVAYRNGGGFNASVFEETAPALMGDVWKGRIALEPGDLGSAVVVSLGGASSGRASSFGEVLVEAPYMPLLKALGGRHRIEIPNDATLLGLKVSMQGVAFGDRPRLTNALDITIGNQLR